MFTFCNTPFTNTKTSSESAGVTDKLNTLLEPFPTLASAFTLLIVPVTPPPSLACTYAESINAITAAESVPPPLVNVPVGNLAESIVPAAIAEAGKGALLILILPLILTPES